MVGSAVSGKKWKQIDPQNLVGGWLGEDGGQDSFSSRWERAMKAHNERRDREVAKKRSAVSSK